MHILADTPTSAILEFLNTGGLFIYPLILCSIAGITAIGFKFMSLSRARTVPAKLSREMADNATANSPFVQNQLQKGRSTLARLGKIAVAPQQSHPDKTRQSLQAAAREEIVKMHSGIGVLDVVITVSPLLGLLGTASGLVVIFRGLGETTDHLAIAQGIAQALNTTIFGLAIAVPCVIAHSYFTRRIERYTARLETVLTSFTASQSSPAHTAE